MLVADVLHLIDGSRRDALLYSLAANAKHGLQRSATDYTRAYNTACRNSLVDPVDVEAVAVLLRCSGRTAERLTETAREAARAKRYVEIVRLKDQGKSNREVARGERGRRKHGRSPRLAGPNPPLAENRGTPPARS